MKGYNKDHPVIGRLKSRYELTEGCPEKNTHHVVLDISGTDVTYEPGDCVGILPSNSPEQVDSVLSHFQETGALRHLLTHHANLTRFTPGMEVEKIPPLLPRFYSIASSMKVVGEEIHLTIRHIHDGTCTNYLCERTRIGEEIPLFIQKAAHFKLPEDDKTPIIMVGPGTGVAPYRGFLQERPHVKSWLFFGEWTRKHHFFYEEFFTSLDNLKLTPAFSRDQEEKVYVQHKIWEEREELKKWVEEGAILYVCGDAKQMAKAVDKTLKDIFSPQEVRELRKAGRYLRDIY